MRNALMHFSTRNKIIFLFILGILGFALYFVVGTYINNKNNKKDEIANYPQKRLPTNNAGDSRPEYPILEELKNVSEQVSKLFDRPYNYDKYHKSVEITSQSIEDKSLQQVLVSKTFDLMENNGFKYTGKSDIGFIGGKYSDNCSRNTSCEYSYSRDDISCKITTNFDYRGFLIVDCTQR